MADLTKSRPPEGADGPQILTTGLDQIVPSPRVSFLLVTAVAVERDAVLALMQPLESHDRVLKVPHKESTYFLGQLGMYPCSLVLGEAGSDTRKGSAIESFAGLELWSPLAIIAPGIAFGRQFGEAGQVPGDVLVSTQMYPYHHSKLTPEGPEDRGPHPEASVVLIDRVTNSAWSWTTESGERRQPILGPLLTGPHLINDQRARDELFARFPRAIGGEMEATGIYSAASRLGIQWIVIKGVCDWAAEKGDQNQALAARNSAEFVLSLLSESGLDPGAFRKTAPSTLVEAHPGWERVTFSEQVDLGPALSGASMGPRNVEACPPIQEVDDIIKALEDTGAVAVVGPSGCGKSMAAWHAAYRLHKNGWIVYGLTQPLAPGSPPSGEEDPALLVVDDVQSFAAVPVTSVASKRGRRLLLMSTVPIPGFRTMVRVTPEAAVNAIANGLCSRADDVLPVLRRMDPNRAGRFNDVSFAHEIDIAKRNSKLPWQFMFNLGNGHLRLDAALRELAEQPPLDTVLFAIAARQLVSRPIEVDPLRGNLT